MSASSPQRVVLLRARWLGWYALFYSVFWPAKALEWLGDIAAKALVGIAVRVCRANYDLQRKTPAGMEENDRSSATRGEAGDKQ